MVGGCLKGPWDSIVPSCARGPIQGVVPYLATHLRAGVKRVEAVDLGGQRCDGYAPLPRLTPLEREGGLAALLEHGARIRGAERLRERSVGAEATAVHSDSLMRRLMGYTPSRAGEPGLHDRIRALRTGRLAARHVG
jgi:hypothetical protein